MNNIETRLTILEKEVAELKRELEARPEKKPSPVIDKTPGAIHYL